MRSLFSGPYLYISFIILVGLQLLCAWLLSILIGQDPRTLIHAHEHTSGPARLDRNSKLAKPKYEHFHILLVKPEVSRNVTEEEGEKISSRTWKSLKLDQQDYRNEFRQQTPIS